MAQTNPLLLAKQAARLNFIPSWRFMQGAGIGWLPEEFVAMGAPFERRGARFDDYMVAMKKIWSGEIVGHDSDFLTWHNSRVIPHSHMFPACPFTWAAKGKKSINVSQNTAMTGSSPGQRQAICQE